VIEYQLSMSVESLRAKHPVFIYNDLNIYQNSNRLDIDFDFTMEPDVAFRPKVSIPIIEKVKSEDIENFAFHLGLIEAVSYWKSACSPEFIVKAGKLNEQQVSWWHDLFIHGLGEFFYQNNINFTNPNFLSIRSEADAPTYKKVQPKDMSGDLIMVGGGKDSAVTLEILKKMGKRRNVFILNPTRPALEITSNAGYKEPLIIERTIDRKLLDLNSKGYLNGHTPFSAYLAFLGIFVGELHDYENIVASNEQSAGEGNVVFHELEINHQYSKSIRFERLFREYYTKFLTSDIQYFSFLRPLYELQISRLFVKQDGQLDAFCSCNVNRGESWCGECPKCAFVYLSLFPFLDSTRLKEVFGKDFFDNPQIQKHIVDLVGLGEHKPFDCVGTVEESRMAVALVIKKYELLNQPLPDFFVFLKDKLGVTDDVSADQIEKKLKGDWSNSNFLPREYSRLLRKKISQL